MPWIGPGTWLIDCHRSTRDIGVITEIHERDRGRAARISIYWRPNVYENISVTMALDRLIRGDWRVDE